MTTRYTPLYNAIAGLDGTQQQLSQCQAPCFPIDCPDCPFGPMDMTLEEIQDMYLGGTG